MKYYAVIDTNVLVSAMLKWNSVPGHIIELVFDGLIVPVFSREIIEEYKEVLSRSKFHLSNDIVEDIIDSGRTMVAMLEMLKAMKPAEIKICSLLVKPDALKVKLDIDYVCLNIPNDFIVGYGLDYDGYGRELPDIYTCI